MDNIQLYYIDNEINKIDKMKQGDVIYKNGVELLVVLSYDEIAVRNKKRITVKLSYNTYLKTVFSHKKQKELEERLAYLIDKPFLTKEEHDEMVRIGNELPKSPPTTLSFNIRLDKMAK